MVIQGLKRRLFETNILRSKRNDINLNQSKNKVHMFLLVSIRVHFRLGIFLSLSECVVRHCNSTIVSVTPDKTSY